MLYRRGQKWYVKFSLGGTLRYLATGESDRRKAETAARRLRVKLEESEVQERKPAGRPSGVTLETLEAIDLARADDEGLGELRAKTIAEIWRPVLAHFGDKRNCKTLTVGEVVAYCGTRRRPRVVAGKEKPGARGQTVKREVEALVRSLRIAKRDKIIAALPFDPEDLPTIRKDPPLATQRGKVWRLDHVLAVFSSFSAKAVTAGHLDRCKLILLTGLRLEEIHRMQPSWVVPCVPAGQVPALLHVPAEAAKWGKPRTIPLVPEALEIIVRCAPFARKKPNKSLALASKDAGLVGVVTPRDLRTMFLTYAGAADPVAAQTLGGHQNIATTGLYLRSTDERAVDATVAAASRLVPICLVTARKQQEKIAPIV
jgi:integrase